MRERWGERGRERGRGRGRQWRWVWGIEPKPPAARLGRKDNMSLYFYSKREK